MSTTDCEKLVTPSLVREVFQNYIINDGSGWVMTVCGKILTVNGKMLFNSKEQAIKAFYNSYHWRVICRMHLSAHPNPDGYGRPWSDPDRTTYWKTFKKVLEKDYGFKVVHI